MKYEVASTLPYPDIKVEKPNVFYGEILLQDLAGQTSEETSIHKYLYQSITQFDQYIDIANVLENIAKVEMHHLQMIARLVYLLGVDPKYRTLECFQDTPVYWKAQYINYETDIEKILTLSIKQEQAVINQYQNHIEVIQDSFIQEILKRIILDEKIHIKTLEKLQKLINPSN